MRGIKKESQLKLLEPASRRRSTKDTEGNRNFIGTTAGRGEEPKVIGVTRGYEDVLEVTNVTGSSPAAYGQVGGPAGHKGCLKGTLQIN